MRKRLEDFAFVGITERFDESVVLLQRTLKLPQIPYERRQVSVYRPPLDEMPNEQRRRIAELNPLDLELYSFARDLFDDALAPVREDVMKAAGVMRERAEVASEEARTAMLNAANWLDGELPVGTRKPVPVVRSAATAAGISDSALRRAAKHIGMRVERDGPRERHWVRPETATVLRIDAPDP